MLHTAILPRRHFNPRPREEGDVVGLGDTVCTIISIHALVKRATVDFGIDDIVSFISIHALVKRATNLAKEYGTDLIISIHALVKRATKSPT